MWKNLRFITIRDRNQRFKFMNIKIYEVGGSIRDRFLGLTNSKDRDFCVVAPTYLDMREYLLSKGAKIYLERPEYFTIRCKLEPYGDCDFVLARKDGYYTDGRRPDKVDFAQDITDDLSRRDFCCNAMAVDVETNQLIDPFNGQNDCRNKVLKCVGNPLDRFKEDSLRVLRAMRFSITKGFTLDIEIHICFILNKDNIIDLLGNVSKERIREELYKCFKYDTKASLEFLDTYKNLKYQILSIDGLWFKPTFEE